jgi:hypothetical protein
MAERSQIVALRKLLEMAFTDNDTMIYIPIGLKYDNPKLFGKYLCHQNDYLENHRNIAIAGLSTKAMDNVQEWDDYVESSLWSHIRKQPGVLHLDSTKRTLNLGKWNLPITKDSYVQLLAWLDEHLKTLFESMPANIQAQFVFGQFPHPRRLSKTPRSATTASTTDDSDSPVPTSAYVLSLSTCMDSTPKVISVQRSAWRQPVSAVSYDFNKTEFPSMPKKQDTDTNTTASFSHISSTSEQLVKNAIAVETKKMRAESERVAVLTKARFQKMDDSLQALASQLVQEIFAQLISVNSPFVTSTQLDLKLDRISQQIEKLTANTSPQSQHIHSPPCRKSRTTGPEIHSGTEDLMETESEVPNCS